VANRKVGARPIARLPSANRIRWFPDDRLPMQTTETARASGAMLLTLTLPLIGLVGLGIPELVSRGEVGGAVLFGILIALFLVGACWGLHLLWYKKTVSIDSDSVIIEIRTLRDTVSRTIPLKAYGAVVRMDSQVRWWKFSTLLLPDADQRFTVCLAMTRRDSEALPTLHEHFSRLLKLRKEDMVFGAR
jgi:hypothetical protein